MTITVDEAPATSPPNKYGGDPASFDAAMQAHLDWQASALVTQINAQNAENNALNTNMNNQVALVMGAGLANAATNAVAAAANAVAVAAVNTVASAKAAESAASALAAAAARDLSIAAWAASTAPAETLAAISQSIHVGTVVKAIIYDTSKDSDGGAWRKRCTDKSWFTETLGGNRWIGQRASVGAAWTAAGSTAGAVYQSTADGKYYSPTSATVQTEVFRGIAREFPEQVSIVAEASRVVIYDLTVPGCPMWMVFVAASGNMLSTAGLTSIAALNGQILVGNSGFQSITFPSEKHINYSVGQFTYKATGIAARNSSAGYSAGGAQGSIVNTTVNDIAVTVLEGAPIDPATGLPVPTIYVSTNGGVSVIGNTGTVTNIATPRKAFGVEFEGPLLRVLSEDGTQTGGSGIGNPVIIFYDRKTLLDTSSAWSSAGPVWTGMGGWDFKTVMAKDAIGSYLGSSTSYRLSKLKINPAATAKSMVAAITNAYNSGWQVGDSRGAWLSDTVAETITGSGELAVNGTFATDTIGWAVSTGNGATGGIISWIAGVLRIANDATGANYGVASNATAITTVVGKTYTISVSRVGGTGVGTVNIGTGSNLSNYVANSNAPVINIVAAATTLYVSINAGGNAANAYYDFDNISVKLADPDRSVKSNGLSIVGSLSKTAVAAGAQLVAYSGFSAANYLEQPYSADKDYGTGDFYVMGWGKAVGAGSGSIFWRGQLTGSSFGLNSIILGTNAANSAPRAILSDASGATTSLQGSSNQVPSDNAFHFWMAVRRSGMLEMYFDGVFVGSVACAYNLSNANAVTDIGCLAFNSARTDFASAVTLVRTGATAPSADLIAQIYRDELPLFAPGAQCTIAGTSTAVTALAYDDSTNLLHVGTSWGRSAFRGLLRTESEATTTGAITSISAVQGSVLTGGTSARFYQPALQLRDELARKEEARRALGKVPVFFDFDTASFTSPTTSGSTALTASSIVGTPYVGMGVTGTGIPAGATIVAISGTAYTLSAAATVTNAGAVALAQSSFTLQQGYTAKAVYSAEALKREGSTKTYTRAFDGYRETINFAVSPGSAVWVSIMAVRA